MQAVLDAIRITPDLKACVCNVEMPPQTLLDRQLARISGIDLSLIRHRRLGEEHSEPLKLGLDTLEQVAERLAEATALLLIY
jgi:replicative DNA helicase